MLDPYVFIFFLFGAVFGSFANVLIVRLPEDESIVTPSHCRKCKKRVEWIDNIPIFSYFILRGKCRGCGEKFSIRYAAVELVMALLFAWSYSQLGMTWFLFEFLIFVFGAVTASVIDIDHFILPDVFTLGGLAIALIGAAINPERGFIDSVIGMVVGGGMLYIPAYLHFKIRGKEGMGGGDIKLLAWIGALLGWVSIPFVILSSCFAGVLFAVARLVFYRVSVNEPLQFGPFIAAGALVYVLVGQPTIVQWMFF